MDAVLQVSELWGPEIHDFEASQSLQDLENAFIDNLLWVGKDFEPDVAPSSANIRASELPNKLNIIAVARHPSTILPLKSMRQDEKRHTQ